MSVLSSHNKYQKEIKGNFNQADPLLDVLMTIIEKHCPESDIQIKNNLFVSEKVEKIRAK